MNNWFDKTHFIKVRQRLGLGLGFRYAFLTIESIAIADQDHFNKAGLFLLKLIFLIFSLGRCVAPMNKSLKN